MLSSFKGFISKVNEKTKASLEVLDQQVDSTFNSLGEKMKPLQEKIEESVKPLDKRLSQPLDLDPKRLLKTTKQIFVPAPLPVLSPKYYSDGINIYAGLDLVQKYQTGLRTLHENNRQLMLKSQATDRKIQHAYHFSYGEHETFGRFTKDLQAVPELTKHIERMKSEIEIICDRIEAMEALLSQQTEEVAELELQLFNQHESNLTELHSKKKNYELEETEQQMKIDAYVRKQKQMDIERLKLQQSITEQMIKAREQERIDRLKEQEILLEIARQREALTLAFKKEMEAYKDHQKQMEKFQDKGKKGERRKKRSTKERKSTSTKTLEQISLEESKDPSLEAFLGPSSDSESKKLQSPKLSPLSDTEDDSHHLVSKEELDIKDDTPQKLPDNSSPTDETENVKLEEQEKKKDSVAVEQPKEESKAQEPKSQDEESEY